MRGPETLLFSVDFRDWTQPDILVMSPEDRDISIKRRDAVEARYRGMSFRKIERNFGVGASSLRRMIGRCQQLHEDGRIWGCRALASRVQLVPTSRRIPANLTVLRMGHGSKGLFAALLRECPALEKLIEQQVAEIRSLSEIDKKPTLLVLHRQFVQQSRKELANDSTRYPLCTRSHGLRAYEAVIKRILAEKLDFSEASAAAATPTYASVCYEDVEIDCHKLDLQIKIRIRLPDGGIARALIHRVSVIVARDRTSHAVLGWVLVIGKEADHVDILRCIRAISEPWRPLACAIPGIEYADGAGFPSGVVPHCAGRMPLRIHLDNAMAHHAINVRHALIDKMAVTVNWGKPAMPNSRPIIESFFRSLTEGAIQPLPTGFKSQGKSLKKAIENADFASPSLEQLQYYLDVVMANYNAAECAGLSSDVPLDVLRRESLDSLFWADMSLSAPWRRLTLGRQVFNIRTDKRARPYVMLSKVPYESPSFESLVRRGVRKFEGEWDLEDMRYIRPLSIAGQSIEIAKACGPWREFPHDYRLRRIINGLIATGKFRFDPFQDAQNQLKAVLTAQGLEDRASATALANIQRHQERIEKGAESREPGVVPAKPVPKPKTPGGLSRLGRLFPVDLSKG